MKIFKNNVLISKECLIAKSFFKKLFGKLLCRKPCLLLKNCNSIHTFFLNRNLDVIFLDKTGKVIKFYDDLEPFKIIFPVNGATDILECNTNFIKSAKIELEDILVFKE